MIAKLDQRVTIERKTLTDDGAGGATVSWAALGDAWANVRPLSGREQIASGRDEARQGYAVTIRRYPGLLPADRIRWRARILNIRAVKDAGPSKGYLELEAELGEST
jgi:SPP1 family predicted phage head-tail adaptor